MDYKKIIITTLKGLVSILAFLFILTKCTSCGDNLKVVKSDNTELYKRITEDSLMIISLQSDLKESEAKEHVLDSLKAKAENNFAYASKKLRERLKINICDTLEVITVLNECDSVIKVNHAVIAQKDTTIGILKETVKEQADIIEASREVIKNKDNDIAELEKTLKKTKRRNKIKTALIIIADVIKDGLLIFALK